jgi:organic hydroperoxide reductase OsmC/OhrA
VGWLGISEHEYKTRVRLVEGLKFEVDLNSSQAAPLVMDEPAPIGSGQYPNAGQLLAAAVGNCLAASLTFCLQRARVHIQGMSATVYTKLERNKRGRLRVTSIRVELEPAVDEPERLQRCLDIFEDFCIVSQSIRQGIPIQVDIRTSNASKNDKTA